jgi:hypothetical protein
VFSEKGASKYSRTPQVPLWILQAPRSHTRASLKILSSVHHLLVPICHCVPRRESYKRWPLQHFINATFTFQWVIRLASGHPDSFFSHLKARDPANEREKTQCTSAGQIYLPARGRQNSAPWRTSLSARECLNKRPGSPFHNRRVIYGRAEKCNSPLECAVLGGPPPKKTADHPAPILNQFSTLDSNISFVWVPRATA